VVKWEASKSSGLVTVHTADQEWQLGDGPFRDHFSVVPTSVRLAAAENAIDLIRDRLGDEGAVNLIVGEYDTTIREAAEGVPLGDPNWIENPHF